MRITFAGRFPDELLYDPTHQMWVRRDGREVVIGATAFGVFLAGEIIAFTGKPVGARVLRGRGLGTVECAKTVLAVHAPISLEVTDINRGAEARPQLINADPHLRGWMVRGVPLAWEQEVLDLVNAAAYRRHVLTFEPEARIG